MRVALVTNDFPPAAGGIQRYLDGLLSHAPWDVDTLAPAHRDALQEPRVARYDRALQPTRRAISWISDHVESSNPDLVLYAAFPLALVGPMVAERTGVPYALLLHGAEITVPAAVPGIRRRYANTVARATARFSVSRYTKGQVQQRFGVPVTWVGAGVDIDTFAPDSMEHDGFVVGCVGRFVRRKGHADVLRAVSLLRSEGMPARTVMVGWGRRERRLRSLARRLAVPTNFLIHGEQAELIAAYRRMDAFAMPVRSRWAGLEVEGLGLVYLEAAATGLPVIAGASGGAPETVEDGETGFVVSNQEQLQSRLRALAADPDLGKAMGSAGRERVERVFTWKAVVDRVDTGLREALGG